MKKFYSNLCAMCYDPVKCDYPDLYSGYDGSIRCLDQNRGDVAFTKTVAIKKYFGLPIGNGNNEPVTSPQGDADDFEYLCTDGSRLPITGEACSWGKRPWQGFMGNADLNARLENLQIRINNFYTDGKRSHKRTPAKMNIYKDHIIFAKPKPVYPGQYLTQAGYKDVIERDGGVGFRIRFCVSSNVELKKCDTMKRAAYSRGILPIIQCLLNSKDKCLKAVHNNIVDIVAITPKTYSAALTAGLKPVLYESFDENIYVAVVPKDPTVNIEGNVQFEESKLRSVNAALYLFSKLNIKKCPNELISERNSPIKIVLSTELSGIDVNRYELICPDLSRNTLYNFKSCNFDFTLPTAIFSRSELLSYELQQIVNAFTLLAKNFGHDGTNKQVFELFGEFEAGEHDVIFEDSATTFVASSPSVDISEDILTKYNELRCN